MYVCVYSSGIYTLYRYTLGVQDNGLRHTPWSRDSRSFLPRNFQAWSSRLCSQSFSNTLACQDLVLGSQCTIIYIWWLSQVNRWIVRPFFPPTMDIVTRCVARSCRMRWSFTTLVKKCSNWICLLPFTIQPMGSILTVDWLVSGNRSEQYSFPKFNWWL